jgi:hypothetical protein
MSKFHIYTTYYKDQNHLRAVELRMATSFNLTLPYKSFTIFIDESDTNELDKGFLQYYIKTYNVKIISKRGRTSFNDIFDQIAIDSKDAEKDEVFIFMNTDIFLYDLSQFIQVGGDNVCYALSRYDKVNHQPVLFERPDSQDTWVFFGKTDVKLSLTINFGVAGCDNRLAYELEQLGYNVQNPAYRIKTIHYHESAIRNYINTSGEVINRIPPPYKLVPLSQ